MVSHGVIIPVINIQMEAHHSNSEDNNVFKHCKTFEKQHQLSSEPMATIAGPSTSRGNQSSGALSFLNWALREVLSHIHLETNPTK